MGVGPNGAATGPWTKVKLEHFISIAEMWAVIVKQIFARNEWAKKHPALYIDATAGPGIHDDGLPSCCLHFIDALYTNCVPYNAVLVEQNEQSCERLKKALLTRYHYHIQVMCGDYKEVLSDRELLPASKWQFGLIFVDPNNPSGLIPGLDVLSDVCTRMPQLDFLAYVPCTYLKRGKRDIRFSNIIKAIPRDKWLVRKRLGNEQWTFILGTGNKSPLKELRKVGLLDINDPELTDDLIKMEFTAEEQKKILQPELPIEVMRNTCDTRYSKLFEDRSSTVLEVSASVAGRKV